MSKFSIILIVSVLVIGALSKSFPKGYPICFRNDPKINKCLLDATNSVRNKITKGIRDLDVPPTAPLFLPILELYPDSNSAITFNATLINVTIQGLENYKFNSLEYNQKTLMWHADIVIDTLHIDGDADIHAKILALPIVGQSLFKAKLDNCAIKIDIHGAIVQRGGVDYYNITGAESVLSIGKGKLDFDKFRSENPQFSDIVTTVLKENNDQVFLMLEKPIQDFISQFVESFFNQLARQIPYDEFMPKSSDFA